MIIKLLALAAVIYVVYIMFFKNKSLDNKNDDNEQIDTMVECPTCKTFISKDEAIISNGKYFCSNECLK